MMAFPELFVKLTSAPLYKGKRIRVMKRVTNKLGQADWRSKNTLWRKTIFISKGVGMINQV